MVSAETVNCFKTRLDRFWLNRDIIYNFRSEIHGTGSRSEITVKSSLDIHSNCVILSRAKRLSPAPVFFLRLHLVSVLWMWWTVWTSDRCHVVDKSRGGCEKLAQWWVAEGGKESARVQVGKLWTYYCPLSCINKQWLKWFCEAGGGLTWRSQVGANPIPIPTPLIWHYLGVI